MSVHSWNPNGTVFLVIELWAAEPATKKTCQLVAGDVFVIRMHVPDRRETFVATQAIEEVVYECEDSIPAAGRPKGCISDTVLLP